MTNTLVLENTLKGFDEGIVLARLKQLEKGEVLMIKTPISIEETLRGLRRKRFSGLKWKQSTIGTDMVFEIENEDADDCCGCCGSD